MSVYGALAGGFLGTIFLEALISAASVLHLTRVSLPFLLGTAFTADRVRARKIGYAAHAASGLLFALIYFAIFAAVGHASWRFGLGLGLLQGLFVETDVLNRLLPAVHPRMGDIETAADTTRLIEAPGFLMLNYGWHNPVVLELAHAGYGAIVGATVVWVG